MRKAFAHKYLPLLSDYSETKTKKYSRNIRKPKRFSVTVP